MRIFKNAKTDRHLLLSIVELCPLRIRVVDVPTTILFENFERFSDLLQFSLVD